MVGGMINVTKPVLQIVKVTNVNNPVEDAQVMDVKLVSLDINAKVIAIPIVNQTLVIKKMDNVVMDVM